MKTKAVLLLCLVLAVGTAFLIGGVVTEELEPAEPEIPIAEIHEEVTTKFINAMGFGFSRIISSKTRKPGTTFNHQLTYFIEGSEEYKVNLIGLVKNPKGRVYISASEQNERHPKEPNSELSFKVKELTPRTTPPTALDNRAIDLFNEQLEAKPQLLKTKGTWIGHGPIRATKARCIKCHEVEKGTLLGVFRYEFVEPID